MRSMPSAVLAVLQRTWGLPPSSSTRLDVFHCELNDEDCNPEIAPDLCRLVEDLVLRLSQQQAALASCSCGASTDCGSERRRQLVQTDVSLPPSAVLAVAPDSETATAAGLAGIAVSQLQKHRDCQQRVNAILIQPSPCDGEWSSAPAREFACYDVLEPLDDFHLPVERVVDAWRVLELFLGTMVGPESLESQESVSSAEDRYEGQSGTYFEHRSSRCEVESHDDVGSAGQVEAHLTVPSPLCRQELESRAKRVLLGMGVAASDSDLASFQTVHTDRFAFSEHSVSSAVWLMCKALFVMQFALSSAWLHAGHSPLVWMLFWFIRG